MERNIKTRAIVLSVRKYGELHKALTLLCHDLGFVDAFIYGGRKGRKTALAPLFSINTVELYHNPVKKEYSVTEAVSTFIPDAITNDLGCTYAASFFCEIIAKTPTDEPAQVFSLLGNALNALEENPEIRKRITAVFILKLMQLSGTAPDLQNCPVCDKTYSDNEVLFFSEAMGVPCCKSCSDSERLILLPGSRRYLRYTMNLDFSEAIAVELNPAAEQRIYTYMLRWAETFSQTHLKTVKELLSY